MYRAEPRYNDLRYNDIPGLTMGMSLTKRKIFPITTIKSISQTTGNANIEYNKTNFYYINNNSVINVSLNSYEWFCYTPVANVNCVTYFRQLCPPYPPCSLYFSLAYPGITIFLEILPQYRYNGNSAITISRLNDIILTLPWHIVKPGFHCIPQFLTT